MTSPVVEITLREIYEALVVLRGRVDVLIAQQTSAQAVDQDHETRLRSLERRQWPLPTIAVVASLAALAVGILPHLT